MWVLMAILSAVFAGITSILTKCGIKKTDSDVATSYRTLVVLVFSWIIVFIVGSYRQLADIDFYSLIFLILSGLSTGLSWLCYFKALSLGDVNKVVVVDKSSTILTVIMAMIFFGETNNLWVKIIGVIFLSLGIFMTIEKKHGNNEVEKETSANNKWLPYAVASAVFAALTSILAKVGIKDVESNLATAIRTSVVLIMAWLVVFAKKKQTEIPQTDTKDLLFIVLSGVATGASWLCYYYAIQNGLVSVVAPIDKLSVLISVVFSVIFFKEKISKKAIIGFVIMISATMVMAIWG